MLELMSKGFTCAQIGSRLGCTASAVHCCLSKFYREIDATNGYDALRMALEMGWIR